MRVFDGFQFRPVGLGLNRISEGFIFALTRLKETAVATLKELLSQKQALDAQIDLTRKTERADAIAKVQALMAEYGLSVTDLTAKRTAKPTSAKGGKVAAKYRNTATGDAWSGRGLQPKWLKAALASGRKLTDFAV